MKKLVATGIITMFAAAPVFAGQQKMEEGQPQEAQAQESKSDVEHSAQKVEAQKMEEGDFADQPVSRDDAKKVQEQLADKGFYEGEIDGKIGPQTSTGIEKFQENNDLTASGELNQETLEALGVDANLIQAQQEKQQEQPQEQQESSDAQGELNRDADSSVGPNSDSSATRQGDYQYDESQQQREEIKQQDETMRQEEVKRQEDLQKQEDIDSRGQEHQEPKVNESGRVDDAGTDTQEQESEY